MTRGPLSFKETDLMRAIKCALKAGLQVAGFEINPKTGSIRVDTGQPANDNAEPDGDWDKALAREGN
jgi:hypothetical protein